MRKKIFKKQNEISFPVKVILGFIIPCLIGTLTTVIISFIFSFILSKSSEITTLSVFYFIISVAIGSLLCGFISTKMLTFKGLISGLVSGIPLSLFIFVIMLYFSNGKLSELSIIILAVILLSSTIGGIISANTKRRK